MDNDIINIPCDRNELVLLDYLFKCNLFYSFGFLHPFSPFLYSLESSSIGDPGAVAIGTALNTATTLETLM